MGYRIYGDDIEPLNTVAQAEALSYSKNTIVSVLETGRAYQFDPASVAARDGIRVLTPAGGGRLVATKGLVSTDGVHLKGDGGADDPIEHSQDTTDLFRFFVGSIISGYSAQCTIASNGTTVTASVQSEGGGDIRYVTLDGYATLDCTPPATVVLSAGSDSSPTENWIYIDIADGILKKSTSGFPSSPHVPIDKRLIPSASFVQSYGTYPGNNFSDHVYTEGDNGHLTHINQNFRYRPPQYISGSSVTISGSGTNSCTIAVASGSILMTHLRNTPSFSNGSNFLVANDQTTPYQLLSNLYNLTTDTTGSTLTGRWAAHFLWYGHSQESSGAKLFINKPSGSYLDPDLARADSSGYFNTSVPPSFRGCAIGLRRIVARRSATNVIDIDYKTSDDWRGKLLASVPGSGGTTSFSSVFPDNQFKVESSSDSTKEIVFSASSISAGQTRTITMPDNNVDLGPASRIASPSQSGLMSDVQATIVSKALTGVAKRLTSNVSVISSTTPVSITDLGIPIDANQSVIIECKLDAYVSLGSDLRIAFTGPANPAKVDIEVYVSNTGDNSATIALSRLVLRSYTDQFTVDYSSNGSSMVSIYGVIKNGSTAGTIYPQFAQRASTANTVYIYEGLSYIKATYI